jgi:hypothetical protein
MPVLHIRLTLFPRPPIIGSVYTHEIWVVTTLEVRREEPGTGGAERVRRVGPIVPVAICW